MVHLLPLPGSPRYSGDVGLICDAAIRDAELLLEGGCDALIVENMGDVPYLRGRVDPETVAAMAIIAQKVVALGVPTGVQILAGANREALGVAIASGAAFVRAEAFAYAHVADEGLLESSAAELLRARRNLGADVRIWADVQKKHAAHAITSDLSLGELAKGTAFSGADAVIVTGKFTSDEASLADVHAARAAQLPVIVGSGVTPENASRLARAADGLIVGSWFKKEGDWRNQVSLARVQELCTVVKQRP